MRLRHFTYRDTFIKVSTKCFLVANVKQFLTVLLTSLFPNILLTKVPFIRATHGIHTRHKVCFIWNKFPLITFELWLYEKGLRFHKKMQPKFSQKQFSVFQDFSVSCNVDCYFFEEVLARS